MSPGEIVGVIGANGAGKTTLFDVISGFVRPPQLTGGAVALLGKDVTRLSPDARHQVGLCRSFQNVRLFAGMTARDNIAVAFERVLEARSPIAAALWLPNVRKSEQRIMRRVDSLIGSLGLGAYSNKFMDELSTGTRRLVEIACLLAAGPRLLLLDEPSSGLAQAETEELGPVILRIRQETGCGILLIEHDLPLVSTISARLIAMERGSVLTIGKPAEVMEDKRVVEAYLGASEEALARSGVASASRRAPNHQADS
jgi:branched-chain amino acid transport system ATP-binding protein